jgi:hypothetical protein
MKHPTLTPATKGRGNDQLLYFHSANFLRDGSGFVFIRTEGFSPNIFLYDLTTSTEKQLSHFNGGYLKSYIYYAGDPESGLGKACVTFDPENNLIYFIHGCMICSVDLEGRLRELAELPSGQVMAYTAINHNGKRLCVPTTDAESLPDVAADSGHFYSIDHKIRELNLDSQLWTGFRCAGRVRIGAPRTAILIPSLIIRELTFTSTPTGMEKIPSTGSLFPLFSGSRKCQKYS